MQASKTGPKGVLADYSLHQAELEEQRERKQREISDMMEKQVVSFKEEVCIICAITVHNNHTLICIKIILYMSCLYYL